MAETFEVIAITERTKLVPGMGFDEVEDVTYKTSPHGLVGTVSIPKSQATPEHVREVIAAEVERKHDLFTS